jgi:hypothetical protein
VGKKREAFFFPFLGVPLAAGETTIGPQEILGSQQHLGQFLVFLMVLGFELRTLHLHLLGTFSIT